MNGKSVILGVDAGGQSYKYALIGYEDLLPVTALCYLPVDSNGDAAAILDVWHEVIHRGMDEAGKRGMDIRAMACSCPGPFDYLKGISLMDHKWKAIKGVPLAEDFHGNGLSKDIPVFFCHDGNSLVLGEMAIGVAKGFRRVGGYIIGTGLGFGACCDGNLQIDAKGNPVFRLFSRPYRGETIEAFAASRGVPRWYETITGRKTEFTAKDIGAMAQNGDTDAIRAYRCMGMAIAEASADIIRNYGLQCLVFGGRISNSFPIFGPAYAEELVNLGLTVPFMVQSNGGEALAMSGASSYGKMQMEGAKA